VGKVGEGFKVAMATLDGGRIGIASQALGIAKASLEVSTSYSKERKSFGVPISQHQAIQFMLADMATDLAMCEAWLFHVARMVDQGTADIGIEASMLKMRASDLAMRIATDAVQLYGGYGYCKDYRVERLMRDAKITQIWEGTNQIHRQLIGRSFIQKS